MEPPGVHIPAAPQLPSRRVRADLGASITHLLAESFGAHPNLSEQLPWAAEEANSLHLSQQLGQGEHLW